MRPKPEERKSFAGRKLRRDPGVQDPDAADFAQSTVWLFREALAKAGLVAKFFVLFNQHFEAKGSIARGGQIVWPMQRNSENETIKAGRTPLAALDIIRKAEVHAKSLAVGPFLHPWLSSGPKRRVLQAALGWKVLKAHSMLKGLRW
jgi:hypothetical protein